MAVTALLPVVLYPLFGIMDSKDVSFATFIHIFAMDFIKTQTCMVSKCIISVYMCVLGLHAVSEGHKHAVFGWSYGSRGC